MADIKEKSDKAESVVQNPATAPASPAANPGAIEENLSALTPDEITKNRKKTTGEVAYERTVYTGFGFFVNEIISLIGTDQFQSGAGKKYFEKASEAIAKLLRFEDKVKTVKGKEVHLSGKGRAGNLLMWASLNAIGTLPLIPMKMMEDKKEKWVKKFNHTIDAMRGNKLDEEAIRARDEEVDRAIACEHKQSWGTLAIGRIAAMGTAISTGYLLGQRGNKWLMDSADHAISTGTRKTNELLGGDANSTLGKLANADANHWFRRNSRLIGPETLGCLITSTVLEAVSKLFAKKKPEVKNPELCEAEFVDVPAAANLPADNAGGGKEEKIKDDKTSPANSAARAIFDAPKMSFADKVISSSNTLQPGL